MTWEKTYLGDGVYASFDGYQVWIWTSNGIENSPRIALEPGVLDALNAYDRRCRTVRAAPPDEPLTLAVPDDGVAL